MKDVLKALIDKLNAGRPVVLVRVVDATGSAPRGPGAAMLADAHGHLAGTVGGGTVEYEAARLAATVLAEGGARIQDYSLKSDEAAELGMVCGGDMRLLFQRIAPDEAAFWRDALDRSEAGEACYLATELATGRTWIADAPPDCDDCFAQPLAVRGRTYVFGAGHVAQALTGLLNQTGFRVVVLDDRADFASAARFPGASDVRVVDFENLGHLSIAEDDDALIMTRGHAHDLAVLAQMLKTPARYIGMMGSKAKRAFVYDHLRARGYGQADIARVHSPIGLAIGAQTPAEIAVSVAAELIRVRAGT